MLLDIEVRSRQLEDLIISVLENVAIITMYCHLRPPDAIAFRT